MKRLQRYLTAKNLLYLGFFCILLFPWLFTRIWGLLHFNENTSVIGDTIGGITGPVSGFLGAALVYLALKEQINANKIIIDQFQEQKKEDRSNSIITIVTEQLKILMEDIKDFEYTYKIPTSPTVILNGKDAVNRLMSDYPDKHISNPKALIEYNNKIIKEIITSKINLVVDPVYIVK